jgi:hypothetical protein
MMYRIRHYIVELIQILYGLRRYVVWYGYIKDEIENHHPSAESIYSNPITITVRSDSKNDDK